MLRDQKKTIAVAGVLVVATYWIAGQFGEWELAGCISGGVLLGLVNHLMTELLAAAHHHVRRPAHAQPDDRLDPDAPRCR